MPGYRRPHTTGLAPAEMQGFDMLEKVFQEAQYGPLEGPDPDNSVLRKSKNTEKRRFMPTVFANTSSSDEDDGSSTASEEQEQRVGDIHGVTPPHEILQAGLKPASRRLVRTPPHLTLEGSGLPPTPPTMANSDENEPGPETLASDTQFAYAVRIALHAKQSGLSTPGRHLLTPEPSPPVVTEDVGSPALQPMLLHPLSVHPLRQYPSSRAESFHTAREDLNQSQPNLPHVHSPDPSWSRPNLPQSKDDVPPLEQRDAIVSSQHTSPSKDHPLRTATPPQQYRRRQRPSTPTSPKRTRRAISPQATPDSNLDLDKHISYISNEDDIAPYFQQMDDRYLDGPLDLSWLDPDYRVHDPVGLEAIHDEVYRHIQDENVKRLSMLSNGSAVAAGIFVSQTPAKERTLKRAVARETLRDSSCASEGSPKSSANAVPAPLRLRKARVQSGSLEASPVFATDAETRNTVRSFTDPHAQSRPHSDLTNIGLVRNDAGFSSSQRQHSLRHTTKNGRLAQSSPQTDLANMGLSSHHDPTSDTQYGHHLRHASKNNRLEDNPRPTPTNFTASSARQLSSQGRSPNLNSGPRTLRHFSRDAQLDHNTYVRRTSADLSEMPGVPSYLPQELHPGFEDERNLRHIPKYAKLESNTRARRTSLDAHNSLMPTSPRKNSLDARLLHPSTTPLSVSQFSDQTAVEVCEAKGVSIYPHNNDSLLVVQHCSRPPSKGKAFPSPNNYIGLTNDHMGIGTPLFSAHVQEPSPTLSAANPAIFVDSPLTHPRAAPTPPAFMVIPPTPNEELERQLSDENLSHSAMPERRPSLIQRARRFSESFVEKPFFSRSSSIRKSDRRVLSANEPRPSNLSPLWQPRRFWDGYDSDSDVEEYEDLDGLPSARLPAGGDTSSVETQKRKALFPRNMSVRMPGFRGQGGFLLGNSLGLDRHGTNNRRHHVVVRKSSGGLHTSANGSAYVSQGGLRKRTSEEMLKQMVGRKGGITVPFTGGKKARFVGTKAFREKMSQIRAEKERKEREKRRVR